MEQWVRTGLNAAVCKNVRMVEDEDIVIRGKAKEENMYDHYG